MKKLLFLILILICPAFFSACSDTKSIGVIGGADGPTAVLISKCGESEEKKEPLKMMKVGGELYYDTKRLSETEGRCGVLDDALYEAAEEYEIPKNDGETNFKAEGTSFGYQAVNGKKEVPTGEGWTIFEKLTDDEMDLSKYKYCYRITGRLPDAAKESEIIVLANDKALSFSELTKQFYSLGTEEIENVPDAYVRFVNEENGEE